MHYNNKLYNQWMENLKEKNLNTVALKEKKNLMEIEKIWNLVTFLPINDRKVQNPSNSLITQIVLKLEKAG